MNEFAYLLDKLKDPEYLTLLLQPFMIWGLAIGVLAFMITFMVKERKTRILALSLIIFAALMIVPYLSVRKQSDKQTANLFATKREEIQKQQTRWLESQWVYFGVAGLAGMTILMGADKGKPGLFVGIATAGAGTAAVFFTMWLHLKDAEIYHPNLRQTTRVKTTETRKTAFQKESSIVAPRRVASTRGAE
jgi:hypothetical protein